MNIKKLNMFLSASSLAAGLTLLTLADDTTGTILGILNLIMFTLNLEVGLKED